MLLIVVLVCSALSQPLMFIAVTHHGSRSPLRFMPWDTKEKWPYGPMQVTSIGLRQEYLLGQYLYENYIKEAKLLSFKYNPDEFLLYSSHKYSNMQSAQAIALGLFPKALASSPQAVSLPHEKIDTSKYAETEIPDYSQLIPVHVSKYTVDPLLVPLETCLQYSEHGKRRYKSSAIRDIYKKFSDVIRVVQEYMKINQKDAESIVLDVLDSVICNKAEGYEVPEVFSEGWVTRASYLHMEIQKFIKYQPEYVARFAGSEILKELAKLFDYSLASLLDYKGIVYTGDDTTILNILSTLGIGYMKNPPFASILLFELYKDKELFYVRISFNGDNILLPGHITDVEWKNFRNILLSRAFFDVDGACADIGRVVEVQDLSEQSNDDLTKLLAFDLMLMIVAIVGIRYVIKRLHK